MALKRLPPHFRAFNNDNGCSVVNGMRKTFTFESIIIVRPEPEVMNCGTIPPLHADLSNLLTGFTRPYEVCRTSLRLLFEAHKR